MRLDERKDESLTHSLLYNSTKSCFKVLGNWDWADKQVPFELASGNLDVLFIYLSASSRYRALVHLMTEIVISYLCNDQLWFECLCNS